MMMMSHLNDSRAMSLIPIICGHRFIFDTYHKGNAWVTPLGQRLGEYSSTMEHMDWGVHMCTLFLETATVPSLAALLDSFEDKKNVPFRKTVVHL